MFKHSCTTVRVYFMTSCSNKSINVMLNMGKFINMDSNVMLKMGINDNQIWEKMPCSSMYRNLAFKQGYKCTNKHMQF